MQAVASPPAISEAELPFKGAGLIRSGVAPLDTDGDGIPDEWELSHGLDPNNPKDARPFGLSWEYTNVEVYLNSLVEHLPK